MGKSSGIVGGVGQDFLHGVDIYTHGVCIADGAVIWRRVLDCNRVSLNLSLKLE